MSKLFKKQTFKANETAADENRVFFGNKGMGLCGGLILARILLVFSATKGGGCPPTHLHGEKIQSPYRRYGGVSKYWAAESFFKSSELSS